MHRCSLPRRFAALGLLAAATAFGTPALAAADSTPPPVSQTAQAAPATQAAHPDWADRFDRAMAAYEVQHFHDAYARLVRLADEGHAEAARIALMMARHGRTLYGADLQASLAQRRQWLGSAVASR